MVQFKNTSNLQSLGVYLLNGGTVANGMKVILERNLKTHEEAKIVSFEEKFNDYNRLNMTRLCENKATVKTDAGETVTNWPFSMMYVAEPDKCECVMCGLEITKRAYKQMCEGCRKDVYEK